MTDPSLPNRAFSREPSDKLTRVMETELDGMRAIARRAAGRVRAAVGADPSPITGIHVQLRSAKNAEQRLPGVEPRSWVGGEQLAQVADGEPFPLPAGARVTPLAQEEAQRRDIQLVPAHGPGSNLPNTSDSARTVAVGSDHGGFALKCEALGWLADLGYSTRDMGPCSDAPCDYPDYAVAVAREVSERRAGFGIVIDGAGTGSAMAAGKVPGVLAANCWDASTARHARAHNHANVLTMGAGHTELCAAREIVETFLKTPTELGRHARRVRKIQALDPSQPSVGGTVR